jgi:hypothetical protein
MVNLGIAQLALPFSDTAGAPALPEESFVPEPSVPSQPAVPKPRKSRVLSIDDIAQKTRVPSEQMLLHMCGTTVPIRTGRRPLYSTGFIAAVYKGLSEVSLKDLYRFLGVDEAFAFAARSGELRKDEDFRLAVSDMDLHQIFAVVNGEEGGLRFLNARMEPRYRDSKVRKELNPYAKRSLYPLKDRLARVSPDAAAKFIDSMRVPSKKHLFPGQAVSYRIEHGDDAMQHVAIIKGISFSHKNNQQGKDYARTIREMLISYHQ